MPKLSVIVPVYNVESYLPKCIDSLIGKSRDYEIILVNDGSTDGSAAILADYAARYPELIRVITTQNCGVGQARNTGIEAARGEYFLFADSDDYLAPGAVDALIELCDGSFELCFFDAVSVNESGKALRHIPGVSRPDGSSFSLEEYPALLLELPAPWNKIYRRELFLDTGIRYPGRAWFEDLRATVKLYPYAARIKYVAKTYYNYLQREGSITNARKADRNIEILDALEDLESYYREIGLFEKYRNELEFLALKHMLLASSLRVVMADPDSPLLDTLLDAFIKQHPEHRANPYMNTLSAKERLIYKLLMKKRRRTLRRMFLINNALRGKFK